MAKKIKRRIFVVCVTDFGAKGDGLADDSEAFRLALKSLAAKIKMPARRFQVDTSVEACSDMRFTPTGRKSLS